MNPEKLIVQIVVDNAKANKGVQETTKNFINLTVQIKNLNKASKESVSSGAGLVTSLKAKNMALKDVGDRFKVTGDDIAIFRAQLKGATPEILAEARALNIENRALQESLDKRKKLNSMTPRKRTGFSTESAAGLKVYEDRLRAAALKANELAASQRRLTAMQSAAKRVAAATGETYERSFRRMTKQMAIAELTAKKYNATLTRQGERLRSVALQFMITGGVMAAAGSRIVKSFSSASSEMEKASITLRVLIGDAEVAAKIMGDLKEFAKATPFDVPGVVTAARVMLNAGESTDTLIDSLTILGNASAGSGIQIADLTRIFNQIRGVGKLLGQDFRELRSRGVLSLQDLADHLGKTTDEVAKMQTDGKISFEIVRDALAELSEEGGRYHNLMGEIESTQAGLFNKFTESVREAAAAIGDEMAGSIKMFLSLGASFAEWVRDLPSSMKFTIGAIALGTTVAGGAAFALSALAAMLSGVVKAYLFLAETVGFSTSMKTAEKAATEASSASVAKSTAVTAQDTVIRNANTIAIQRQMGAVNSLSASIISSNAIKAPTTTQLASKGGTTYGSTALGLPDGGRRRVTNSLNPNFVKITETQKKIEASSYRLGKSLGANTAKAGKLTGAFNLTKNAVGSVASSIFSMKGLIIAATAAASAFFVRWLSGQADIEAQNKKMIEQEAQKSSKVSERLVKQLEGIKEIANEEQRLIKLRAVQDESIQRVSESLKNVNKIVEEAPATFGWFTDAAQWMGMRKDLDEYERKLAIAKQEAEEAGNSNVKLGKSFDDVAKGAAKAEQAIKDTADALKKSREDFADTAKSFSDKFSTDKFKNQDFVAMRDRLAEINQALRDGTITAGEYRTAYRHAANTFKAFKDAQKIDDANKAVEDQKKSIEETTKSLNRETRDLIRNGMAKRELTSAEQELFEARRRNILDAKAGKLVDPKIVQATNQLAEAVKRNNKEAAKFKDEFKEASDHVNRMQDALGRDGKLMKGTAGLSRLFSGEPVTPLKSAITARADASAAMRDRDNKKNMSKDVEEGVKNGNKGVEDHLKDLVDATKQHGPQVRISR